VPEDPLTRRAQDGGDADPQGHTERLRRRRTGESEVATQTALLRPPSRRVSQAPSSAASGWIDKPPFGLTLDRGEDGR
jgi:hypothetical protein